MANPLYDLMNGAAQMNPQLSQLIQMYKGMQNPSQLLQNNPQLQSILSAYNGDAKSAFYALCRQRNINPDEILKMFK